MKRLLVSFSGLNDVSGDMKYLWTLAKASHPLSHHQLRLHFKRNVAFSCGCVDLRSHEQERPFDEICPHLAMKECPIPSLVSPAGL
jgi:hypothetical protein